MCFKMLSELEDIKMRKLALDAWDIHNHRNIFNQHGSGLWILYLEDLSNLLQSDSASMSYLIEQDVKTLISDKGICNILSDIKSQYDIGICVIAPRTHIQDQGIEYKVRYISASYEIHNIGR